MKKFIPFFSALILLTSCSSTTIETTNLNVSEFSKKMSETDVTVLDVRTPGEFMTGHIQGAQNIDFESANFQTQIESLDKNKTYVVYCRSGNRSGQAVEIMYESGFHSVYNLNGGMIDWSNKGMGLVNN